MRTASSTAAALCALTDQILDTTVRTAPIVYTNEGPLQKIFALLSFRLSASICILSMLVPSMCPEGSRLIRHFKLDLEFKLHAGFLHTGEKVAVKVQRPGVLETVTIDLYIIRGLGMSLKAFPDIQTDVVGLLDEWAERFFEELDYVKEGENATKFAEQMQQDLPQVGCPDSCALNCAVSPSFRNPEHDYAPVLHDGKRCVCRSWWPRHTGSGRHGAC